MKRSDDWSTESEPLQKGPQTGEMDIISKPCPRCGKNIRYIKGNPSNHKCVGES